MRLHAVVRGRVQGVGFRWFVREEARRLGIAGWVRNRSDGGVEVAAEGPDVSIGELRTALERGPDGSRVRSVDSLDATGDPLDIPFIII